jgi:peptidoglycan-associated lipoprotein
MLRIELLKKSLVFTAVSAVFFVLTACSSTGTGDSATGANGDDNGGVQTSGFGSDNGLSNPNAMVPGANQRYFFDFNESNVHQSDLPSIKIQSQYLISHPSASIQIQGNTDIRGSREYNIALGQRRAAAVKDVLCLDGAQGNQITIISYGAEKPIAMGNTENDYAQNRRADVIYKFH